LTNKKTLAYGNAKAKAVLTRSYASINLQVQRVWNIFISAKKAPLVLSLTIITEFIT